MKKHDLITYLDNYLHIASIADYGPQGLQVEAIKKDIQRIALAVDTSPASITAAAKWNADMLLVHHGILWRNVERIAGPFGERVRLLLSANIHLYAAHLALDAHSQVGNNAILAQLLEVEEIDWWCDVMGTNIGIIGHVDTTIDELLSLVNVNLNANAHLLHHGPKKIRKLAIVSGFGADRVSQAKALGADTMLTGETSHANYWAAADYGLNVIFAGHYATETVGVKALGQHLAERFGLVVQFFDFPTAM